MGLYVRTDKFGVVQANHLLTGGYNRVGTMGETEVRCKLVAGDYVWYIMIGGVEKIIEKTRSIGRNYHGCDVIDENNYIMIPFFTDAAHTSVKLKLWGLNFPTFHYTELPQHNHGGQTFASSTHTHSVSGTTGAEAAHTHTQTAHNHAYDFVVTTSPAGLHGHTFSGSVGNTGYTDLGDFALGYTPTDHRHSFTPSGTNSSEPNHTHSASVNDSTGPSTPAIGAGSSHTHPFAATSGVPSATTAIPNAGINGGTLNDTQKTIVDTLINIYITMVQGTWGTAKNYLTTGWGSLVNINANGGTDEIEIFSYLTVNSFCYIKIEEPTVKKGGKIAWHLSLS